MASFDVVVIGSGSAGLAAARRARQLGATVALVEKGVLGGECPNTACVPTKALLRSAAAMEEVLRAAEFGVRAGPPAADWPAVRARMIRISGLNDGEAPTERLLRSQGIELYRGAARLISPVELQVGGQTLTAQRIIVCAGSADKIPPIPGLAEAGFVTHREAIEWEALPESVAIIGAGPVGVEFAQILGPLGVRVALLASGPLPLPREDHQVSEVLRNALTQSEITLETGVRVERVARRGPEKVLTVRQHGATREVAAREVFVATGHEPSLEGMGLEAAGVAVGREGITVDEYLRTAAATVYAAGDVTGVALFTHVASYQGKLAAHNALSSLRGHPSRAADYRVVPRATFCRPEVASVGRTEEQCEVGQQRYRAASLPYSAVERSDLEGESRGLAKLIIDADTGQILGGHIVGAHASDLIHEIAPLMQHRLPVSAISDTIHAFPTFSELWEAVALKLAEPGPANPGPPPRVSATPRTGSHRCLVCGKEQPEHDWLDLGYEGENRCFCSSLCRAKFEAEPDRYAGGSQCLTWPFGYC